MAKKKSKYAEKRDRGGMMYGPGCCGHSLTPERMAAIRRENGTTYVANRNSPYGGSRHNQEY